MKPTEDEVRKAAEEAIPGLEIKNMPHENELHVPVTINGYFYLVVFFRERIDERPGNWMFDSIIER